MELYGMTEDQAQRVIEHVIHARDGLITAGEMAEKIERELNTVFETGVDC